MHSDKCSKRQQNTESLLISFELQRTSQAAKLTLLNSRLSVILYLNECFLTHKLGGIGLLYVFGAKKHFSPFKSFMACHLPDGIFIKGKKIQKVKQEVIIFRPYKETDTSSCFLHCIKKMYHWNTHYSHIIQVLTMQPTVFWKENYLKEQGMAHHKRKKPLLIVL